MSASVAAEETSPIASRPPPTGGHRLPQSLSPHVAASIASVPPQIRVQPHGLYSYFCKELALRPNSAVMHQLSQTCLLCDDDDTAAHDDDSQAAVATHSNLTSSSPPVVAEPPSSSHLRAHSGPHNRRLDLSDNFLGAEGLRPLLQTIRVIHHFVEFDLSNNVLDSRTVGEVTKYLDGVVSLRTINLSFNPMITQLGGRHVKSFVAANVNIARVDLSGTNVTAALQHAIERLCQLNVQVQQNPVLYKEKLAWQRRARSNMPMSYNATPMKKDSVAQCESMMTTTTNVTDAAGSDCTIMLGPNHNASMLGGMVLLPPFHNSNMLVPLGEVLSTPQKSSSDDPPPGNEHGTAVELEPIAYVFAAATSVTDDTPTNDPQGPYRALRLLQEVMHEDDTMYLKGASSSKV